MDEGLGCVKAAFMVVMHVSHSTILGCKGFTRHFLHVLYACMSLCVWMCGVNVPGAQDREYTTPSLPGEV